MYIQLYILLLIIITIIFQCNARFDLDYRLGHIFLWMYLKGCSANKRIFSDNPAWLTEWSAVLSCRWASFTYCAEATYVAAL